MSRLVGRVLRNQFPPKGFRKNGLVQVVDRDPSGGVAILSIVQQLKSERILCFLTELILGLNPNFVYARR